MPLRIYLSLVFCVYALGLYAQPANCVFKETPIKINFGAGDDYNFKNVELANYDRVRTTCPVDGYYSYASYTRNCHDDDWQTLTEDHTPGDVDGNMLLVNGAPNPGIFLKTTLDGFKGGTTYEFSMWIMNLCKITDKCGMVLLPNLTIRLQTPDGNVIAKFVTGYVPRVPAPRWTQHRAIFTAPAGVTSLVLIMLNSSPGGCGNDFAMDDIGFKECVPPPPPPPPVITKKPAPATTKQATTKRPVTNKPVQPPVATEPKVTRTSTPKIDAPAGTVSKSTTAVIPPPPAVLTTRTNALVKRIETSPGEIKVDLYDNGEIDGDTVSIYHNNTLIRSRARLSDKPVSFTITINDKEPYHELIMVAENLGSIPPNTSVMIITAAGVRHEVFISSTEQKNAKVVIELRKTPPQ